jgi:glycosyltransferase involved in cell wall biosynthesis
LAQAIVQSLLDRDTARSMASAGKRLVVERFSTEGMIEGTLRVYEGLLSGPGSVR